MYHFFGTVATRRLPAPTIISKTIGQNAWASAASYIPHNEAVKLNATLHKRLVKEQEKKKRRKRDEEDLETHQRIDDYEGDEDSRTATFRNKKLKLSDNNNTLEKKGTEGKKTRLKKKNKHARTTTTNEADKAKHSSKTPAFNKANNNNNISKFD